MPMKIRSTPHSAARCRSPSPVNTIESKYSCLRYWLAFLAFLLVQLAGNVTHP